MSTDRNAYIAISLNSRFPPLSSLRGDKNSRFVELRELARRPLKTLCFGERSRALERPQPMNFPALSRPAGKDRSYTSVFAPVRSVISR
jgi:hypothetical protein